MTAATSSVDFVEVAGDTLEFVWLQRQQSGTPVVFLHEGLGSVSAWRDFPAQVATQLQAPALLYSRRGYGRSSPLREPRGPDYLHREAWQVLPALLAHFAIERPFLIGHSDGGSIALLYAARFEPSAIAIMAPHVFVEQVTLAGIRDARVAWDSGKLEPALARFHADPRGAFIGWNDGWLDPAFRDWSIETELPNIRCPVLAIQGYQDQYGTMEQLDRIAAAVPATTLLKLEQCGHAPQRDCPDAVLEALAELYKHHPPDSAIGKN